MKNLLSNATEDFRRMNPHLFNKNEATGRTSSGNGIVVRQRGFRSKTEAEYALILEAQKQRGEILDYKFESIKLKIGDGCWYCPDFSVDVETWDKANGVSIPVRIKKFIEVKGFLRDDARVKFLAAQEQHKWASFEMVKKTKQGWTQIL